MAGWTRGASSGGGSRVARRGVVGGSDLVAGANGFLSQRMAGWIAACWRRDQQRWRLVAWGGYGPRATIVDMAQKISFIFPIF